MGRRRPAADTVLRQLLDAQPCEKITGQHLLATTDRPRLCRLAIDAALFTILAARDPHTDTTEKSRAERRGIRPPDHVH
ncbi:hypothetical protein GCM10023195_55390 [Actinoallomurus liliacearum]|uniref:Uncharacterized protein n=1 Tax=Actinoallomurus liliacearum TaxID=1080073 RepID=A0ABP8TP38_9ACTN